MGVELTSYHNTFLGRDFVGLGAGLKQHLYFIFISSSLGNWISFILCNNTAWSSFLFAITYILVHNLEEFSKIKIFVDLLVNFWSIGCRNWTPLPKNLNIANTSISNINLLNPIKMFIGSIYIVYGLLKKLERCQWSY